MKLGLAALLLLAPFAIAAGQRPADRIALDRLHDSLRALTPFDTAALRTEYRTLSGHAPSIRAPLTTLQSGLVALRLGELGADADFGEALASLRRATRLESDWPAPWYLLGVAASRRAAWEQADPLALGNRVGVGTLEHAAEYYAKALSADPGYARAAIALGGLVLSLHDTALYAGALNALRRAGRAGRSPDVLLALGRVERAAGESDSAIAAFEAARAARGPGALELLEIARTRLASGQPEGPSAYFEGASADDSAAVAEYRADLTPIATESELAEFDASLGAARADFLRHFWLERDRAELRGEGERLQEHYRRLSYARRNFALTLSRRFYGSADAYRSGSTELDDRGVIYVRHGDPAERLHPFVFGLMPNETWRYDRADGDLLFHFSSGSDENGGGDLYDYRLVESVLDLHGASDAPVDQLLLSRQSLSPVYGRMLNWGHYGAGRSRARERGIGQASIAFGTTTDSYELQFAHRLSVAANLIAIGREAGRPIGHFVFALASPDSAPPLRGGGSYAVRVRLAVIDGAGQAFATVDTVVAVRAPARLEPGQYLLGRAQLPLPPGTWDWRAAVQIGEDAGAVLPRDTVRVAAAGGRLSLGDLALGVVGASAIWLPSPVDTAYMTPFGIVREGSELELYYEATGASPAARYAHEIAVYRLKGEPAVAERRPVVRVGFSEAAGDSVIRARRTLQLQRLKPGRYLVEVRVSGPDGLSDARRREIMVIPIRSLRAASSSRRTPPD
ncbi:MAG: GWxTD domain-containing protein [Gemmatimonadales bacterium]